MAQHDYINKTPKKGQKKKQPAAQKPFPTVLAVFALLLIGGFAYGLWYIKQNADPVKVKHAQQPAKVEAPVEEKKALPRPPTFIKDMERATVTAEVKEIKSKGPFQMQCGSFRTYEQAEKRKARIAFAGLISEIRRTEGSNGVWYRVRLGPYDKKRAAESDKNRLKRIKIVDCGIWGWT
ncbi:SPOR domain-containing protein [Pseudoalteromonas sp. SMS1]|uniref:SPOR domain-containing protein n=1 Tax=Pseudoalteromonas sp. SMS1 TaxID=2908894 RepID=UPI001F19120D|nr:SPOR domain-containing protein [Pseudoalteromonas sp. SMS1]MCF2858866.1 SPOR domain-containing protein [Pseudoalteromonas sp. SMS1]